MRPLLVCMVSALALASAAACTKSTSDTAPASSATATASTPLVASTPPAASSAPPADTALAAADAGPALVTEGPKKADAGSASAAASASGGGSAAAECGTKPLPDCPLQAWMKSNANPPVMTNDLPKLADVLDKVAGFAPAGYTNWASVAKDGAKAARGGDMTAAKAACRTCHDQYKTKYRSEMRARKI